MNIFGFSSVSELQSFSLLATRLREFRQSLRDKKVKKELLFEFGVSAKL